MRVTIYDKEPNTVQRVLMYNDAGYTDELALQLN